MENCEKMCLTKEILQYALKNTEIMEVKKGIFEIKKALKEAPLWRNIIVTRKVTFSCTKSMIKQRHISKPEFNEVKNELINESIIFLLKANQKKDNLIFCTDKKKVETRLDEVQKYLNNELLQDWEKILGVSLGPE